MIPKNKQIKSKEQLKEWLEYELPRYDSKNINKPIVQRVVNILQLNQGSVLRKHQLLLRKAEYYNNTGKKLMSLLYHVRLSKFQNKHGIHIPINVCEKGLKLFHGGPIVINGNASIGENCSIHMNTGIVAGGHNGNSPKIGKGVIIGIGSVLLGGISIGDYTAIGANSLVNKSFYETDIAIAGSPAKKISNNGAKTWNKPQNYDNKIKELKEI